METYKKIRFFGLLFLFSVVLLWQNTPAQAAGNDNNIEWGGIGHDSRDPLYRSPSGAVTTGTPIRLRLRAFDNDLTGASVRVWNDRTNVSNMYNMTLVAENVVFASDPNPYEFWEVTLPASALPTVYWYRFIVYDGSDTNYYEDDSARTGGWGQVFDVSPDNSWQLTIYDPGFTTPDWVQNAVIYQIFPDRFRDGVPANNPSAGEFFYGANDTIYRSTATDWNTPICDPRNLTGFNCDLKYSQNFYGGDLRGIINQMAYIDSLGVTAIYLNPIFESPSNHKYDTTDFFLIDDNFGTLADFQDLVTSADSYGIRIILDGVFNHSSSDSVYFDRYSRWTGQSGMVFPNANPLQPTTIGTNDSSGACEDTASYYAPWYTFFNYVPPAPPTPPGVAPCSSNRDYPKWFGIFDSLPVFQHDNADVRDYFINDGVNAVGPYWIAQGASGWRLDVAPEIDHGTINDPSDDYWEDFRTAVRAVDPDTYIVGEEWGNPTSWTIGGEWDATMNYQFSAAVLSFWRDEPFNDNDFNSGSSAGVLNPIDANGLNERLLNLEERYAPEAFRAMMNLFGSHDTNRVLFLLDHNADNFNVGLYTNPNYDWSDAISRLRGAALIQMTMPGAPTIYYGDEIGLVGPVSQGNGTWQDDPYNRQPYPWLDQSGTPFYTHLQSASSVRTDLFAYYQSLTSARNSNPALRTGSLDPLLTAGDMYAYGRKMADDSNTVIVIVNSSNVASPVTVNVSGYIPAGSSLTDLLTSTPYSVNASGEIVVGSVPARGGLILRLNTAIARPTCITDLVATSGAGQVNLTWSAATNATVYDIYRSRLSGGGYELLLANHPTTSYSDTTVQNAITYYYMAVGKNSTTLLTSEFFCNNEDSATPALSIGWHSLDWPQTLTHTLSAVTPTANIYGQVYIAGATDGGLQAVGVIGEVGYGAVGVAPSDPSWIWFPTTFNSHEGNNDSYVGTLLPTAAGTFWYTYRWSTDGGVTWRYSQWRAPGGDYVSGNVGTLTVDPPTDTTPPADPVNLVVLAASSTSVTLGWDANTDPDIYGYRVYRENTGTPGYTLINTVIGGATVQYIDNTVTSGQNYNYYITALDTSLNESGDSNIENVDAVQRQVAVTFNVTVPNPSPGTIHIVGSFNGWNPSDPAYQMTQVGVTNVWTITFNILDGASIQYKYSRGDWFRGDKAANGNDEIPDRVLTADYGITGTQTQNDTVANWRDPLVVSTTPADAATGVPGGNTFEIVWNQDMPANLSSCVTINGPMGPVTGTWVFDAPTNTSTLTPSAVMDAGTHTVVIGGCVDIAGDVQQVTYNSTFEVGLPTGLVAVTFSTTVPSHTPSDVYIIGNFGDFGASPHTSPYVSWTLPGIPMTQISPTLWEVTLLLPDTETFDYKYVRGSWETEERDADGYGGGGDRNFVVADGGGQIQTVTNTVGNWRDPYVISVSPANASINNPSNTVVVITWNKNMPAFAGTFTLSDSVPAIVASTVASGTNTYTLTPDAVLPDGSYSVAASGNTDSSGNTQQVPFASTFVVNNAAGVNVTFSVTVPSHTPGVVNLIGTFASVGGLDWTHMPMTNVGGDVWEITFNNVTVGTNFEYKYTRGSWETVEKEADGNAEILGGGVNRTYTVTSTPAIADTVANWRDPYVISSSPVDGAIVNDGNIPAITFTWNQDMSAVLPNNAPNGVFTVLDSALNPVAGTLTYDSASDTHTFAPTTLPLGNETYTITLSDNTDVVGDEQQFVSSFAFTVTSVLYDLNDDPNTFFNLQWPPNIGMGNAPQAVYELSAITPTTAIYGQIWINGVTNTPGQTAGLLVELGFGPDGVAPNDPAWVWSTATFNSDVGNNDEYMGTLLPTAVGNYDYLYRYSGDGGATWYYGTTAGEFRDLTMATYNPANAGQLTVTAPTDTTPPADVTSLSVVGVSDTQIQLGWVAHPNTDGDLYAFEIYRDGVLLDTITDPLATSYTDTTVVTGTSYNYYIIAVDTSLNASGQSNTVTATASTTVVVPPVDPPPVNPPGNNPPNTPPRPMLIIRFENNNNFVIRGGGRALVLIFENFSGNGMTGTLELVLPRGLTFTNPRSSHGLPSLFQQIAQQVSNYAKRIGTAQQSVGESNGVRLDFSQIANGDSVTLDVFANVSSTFSQPTAQIEARLIVDGRVVDTTTALLVIENNVLALPSTGETPIWRDVLVISGLALAGFGLTLFIRRKRATA